jgi:hypothetical protein
MDRELDFEALTFADATEPPNPSDAALSVVPDSFDGVWR